MRKRTTIWAAVALMALLGSSGTAFAFNPQPDPPRVQGIQEKVHLPIYDSFVAAR